MYLLLFEIFLAWDRFVEGSLLSGWNKANMGNNMKKKNILYIWFSHFTWTETHDIGGRIFPVVFQ